MLKKMIVLIAAAFAFTVVADYLGIVHISIGKEKPRVLQIRDDYVLKTSNNLDLNSF